MKLEKGLLRKYHRREQFDCGIDSLNAYIKQQAGQDVRKKLAVCFVFTEKEEVKGYYTLSGGSIPKEDIPGKYAKKYPRSYSNIPVILLGRLAVDNNYKGKGIGEYILMDALKESYEVSKTKIGATAIITDPVNDRAESFYAQYGFIKLVDSGKMFLPMQVIRLLFDHKN